MFYVTDLLGAQITSPTRQAAIKRALIAVFAKEGEGKAAKATPHSVDILDIFADEGRRPRNLAL